MDRADLFAMISGEPGEAVPQVDPEDIKAVWKLGQDVNKDHPGDGVVIGMAVFEHACKPGAMVKAVIYRANRIAMLRTVAPDVMEPLIQDKLDAVLHTAATIRMEWIGREVHKGWTFDPDDFIRRVREA
jgi:hypothetical protein